jgi:thioredoxin reductase
VPNIDEAYVSSLESGGREFHLTLDDGRLVLSQAVVMATGLYYYAHRPVQYDGYPSELVSHAVDHHDLHRFAGKHVVVIGGGQSAVENAALLYEAGAAVQLVSRRPIDWLAPDRGQRRSVFEQLRAPRAGISPGWKPWALEHLPYLFYRFPQSKKDRFMRNRYGPAAADWLRARVIGKVMLHEGQAVQKVKEAEHGLELVLSNERVIRADHVMLATGYRVNIRRLPMLHQSLFSRIETELDIPLLNPWFESSVPGLFFIGLPSVRSFGPLNRFVVGDKAAAQRVASAVARRVVSGT